MFPPWILNGITCIRYDGYTCMTLLIVAGLCGYYGALHLHTCRVRVEVLVHFQSILFAE